MSLTDFIKDPVIRDRLTEAFPNQGTRASTPAKAEWQTQNYMLVGTAFDYLLRFWLRNTIDTCYTRPWVAETSLEFAEQHYPEKVPRIKAIIQEAKRNRDEYLETGTISRSLVESALDLARVDWVYRSGDPPTNIGVYNDGDIVDCIRLLQILNEDAELEGENIHLNPRFGLASSLVSGADADFILDGTLVDVKTTKSATFKADYWRQLVGYLILADLHTTLEKEGVYDAIAGDGLTTHQFPEIDSFGVYFARHGELSTTPATVIYDSEEYEEVREWFVEKALVKRYEGDDEIERVFKELFQA